MPLEIKIKENELWDENREEFVQVRGQTIHIEHSLYAIAKWESQTKKPFLSEENLHGELLLEYIRCMTLEEGVDRDSYKGISRYDIERVRQYMNDSMTATWFKQDPAKSKRPGKVITAEIIYYYMVELGIPFECEHWHFNRLMTLITVCIEKQQPPKKMAKKDVLSQYANLNAARRARLKSKG